MRVSKVLTGFTIALLGFTGAATIVIQAEPLRVLNSQNDSTLQFAGRQPASHTESRVQAPQASATVMGKRLKLTAGPIQRASSLRLVRRAIEPPKRLVRPDKCPKTFACAASDKATTKPAADHPISSLGAEEQIGQAGTGPLPVKRSGSSLPLASRPAKVHVEPAAAVRSEASRTVLVHKDDRIVAVSLDQKPILMRLPPRPGNERPLVRLATRPAVEVVHDGKSNKSPVSDEPTPAARSEESRDVLVEKDDRIAASDEATTRPAADHPMSSLGTEEQIGQAGTGPWPVERSESSLRVASRPAKVSVEPAPAVRSEESRTIVVHKDDRIVAATLDHKPMLKRLPPRSGNERPLVRLGTRPAVEVVHDGESNRSPRANHLAPPYRDEEVYGGLPLIRRKIDAAFDRATRGALYSARSALLESLRLLAAHLDASEGTSRHREALAAAFQCLDEAEDFLPPSQPNRVLDVVSIAASHRTPLADSLPPQPTAAGARAMYYRYAIAQFSHAFPNNHDASRALYGLGKLTDQIGKGPVPRVADVSGKAIVFHRAALALNGSNGLAANELGVLLNRVGQYELGAGWLYRSARLTNRPEAWRNLAVVLCRGGETEMANEVQRRVNRFGRHQIRRQPAVKWVSPAALAAGKPRDSDWPSRRR